MIIGTGVDLVQVARIRKAIEKWNGRFLSRIYTPQEISYCKDKKQGFLHFAARFAAKEAVRKALEERMDWKEVEIINGLLGNPKVNLRGNARAVGRRQGAKKVFLSLSHDRNYAIAQAVVISDESI
ncbi:MAG: holo-[acyl-carrier-protein] synthase [Nitrospirae bacterium]|nr:holo-[acyl-carrier-protein] synthase [Nitrospirota bacterium]